MNSRNFPSRYALLACLCATLAVACGGGDKPEALVSSAKDYLVKGDAKAAVVQLKSALQKNSELAEARFLLGRAYLDTEDVLAAEKELRKALELGYPAGTINPILAQVRVRKGEFKQVVEEYAQTEASTPRGTAELHTAVGNAQLALGNQDAARNEFAAAQAADPHYALGFFGEAQLLALRGDLDGAIKRTETAIAAAPADPEGWLLKGGLLAAQRQSAPALEAYRKAIEVKHDFVPARAALVGALLQTGNVGEASKSFGELKTIAPKHPQTLYLEALLRLEEKDLPAARIAIQEYQRLVPNDIRGALVAATIEYRMNLHAEAEAHLLTVLRYAPKHEHARRMLVGTYVARGETSKALEALKPLVGTFDKDAPMLNMAGEIYLRNGDPVVAASYFKKASVVDPGGSNQRTGLALTQLVQGQTEQGLKDLESTAATDPGIRADMVYIAVTLKQQEYDKALRAIDALERKQPDKPLAHNLRGLALVGKKDVAAARKSFERAVALDAAFIPAVANLARLDLADKKPGDAEKRFEAVIAKDPKSIQGLLALAELRARNKGSSEEVAGLIAKAVAAKPSEVAPRLALIDHYLRIKEPKKAVAAAQEALAANPGRPEILDALGRAQLAAGDTNQALATYNQLVAAAPTSPEPLLRLAGAQAATKDYDGAAQSLSKALAMKPDLINAQRGLIALDLGKDRTPEALKIAREVQKQRPEEAIGYLLEGDIHVSKKAWKEAAAAYRSGAKQSGSGQSEAAIKLHVALRAAGQAPDADKAAAAWLKDHPEDARYRLYLAEVAGRQGDFRTSLKHYEALLEKQPNNAMLMNNFAWTAGKLNDPRAIEYAEKANTIAPDQAPVMDTLGTLLVEKGDAARGVELLRKATERAPDAGNIRLNLAKALIRVGQKDAAKKELETLAKLGDKFPDQAEVTRLTNSL